MKDELDKFIETTSNEALRVGIALDQHDQLNNELLINVRELKKEGSLFYKIKYLYFFLGSAVLVKVNFNLDKRLITFIAFYTV